VRLCEAGFSVDGFGAALGGLTARFYCSPSSKGVGRCGSQVHERRVHRAAEPRDIVWPLRRVVERGYLLGTSGISERLECGHSLSVHGSKPAKRRRCAECAVNMTEGS